SAKGRRTRTRRWNWSGETVMPSTPWTLPYGPVGSRATGEESWFVGGPADPLAARGRAGRGAVPRGAARVAGHQRPGRVCLRHGAGLAAPPLSRLAGGGRGAAG